MCLSIPSKIVAIDADNMATVDTMGVRREVSLDLLDEPAAVGEYVLIHVGFAMSKIDEENALASLELYSDIIGMMEEDEKQRLIEDDDHCDNRSAG